MPKDKEFENVSCIHTQQCERLLLLLKDFYYPQLSKALYTHRIISPSTSYRKGILDTVGEQLSEYVNPHSLEDTMVAIGIGEPLRKVLGLQRRRQTMDLVRQLWGGLPGDEPSEQEISPHASAVPPMLPPLGRHTLPGFQLFIDGYCQPGLWLHKTEIRPTLLNKGDVFYCKEAGMFLNPQHRYRPKNLYSPVHPPALPHCAPPKGQAPSAL